MLDDLDDFLNSEEYERNLQKELKEREEQRKCRPQIDKPLEKTWIYPVDPSKDVRQYQYDISHSALFKNTLVCIPTGLGKTFIASVVMYNFYRWFPTGKMIFILPTLSLVFQQHEACSQIVHFLKQDVATMTGNTTKPKDRKLIWKKKRVFFSTASIVVNDLRDEVLPANQIVLLVFDEAHKATYNHDYCTIIKYMSQKTNYYRVLGLSATPGKDMATIQNVITNLQISHVEARSEEDLQRYSHFKQVVVREVTLTEPILKLKELFFQIVGPSIATLNRCGAYYETDLEKVSYHSLFAAHSSFIGSRRTGSAVGMAMGAFGVAIKFFHCYSDLITQDINVFIQSWENIQQAFQQDKKKNKLLASLLQQPLYHTILRMAKSFVNQRQEHPKMVELGKTIKEHFDNFSQTKVIIFASQKLTVKWIVQYLSQKFSPKVRAMEFVGQNKGKNSLGLTAKEQKEIIDKFTKGNYNVLVSTSVGEEGLDIGEVDMIICYDAVTSPTRLIQRMGRTGRKRDGRAVMILTEGFETLKYQKAQERSLKLFEELKKLSSQDSKHCKFYDSCPRMISYDVQPECLQQDLRIDHPTNTSINTTPAKKKRKQPLVTTTDRKYLTANYGLFKPTLGNFYNFLSAGLAEHSDILTPSVDIPHSETLKSLVAGSQRRIDYSYNWSDHTIVRPQPSARTIQLTLSSDKIRKQAVSEEESVLPTLLSVRTEDAMDELDVGQEQMEFMREEEARLSEAKQCNNNEEFGGPDPLYFDWSNDTTDKHVDNQDVSLLPNEGTNPTKVPDSIPTLIEVEQIAAIDCTDDNSDAFESVFGGMLRPLLVFKNELPVVLQHKQTHFAKDLLGTTSNLPFASISTAPSRKRTRNMVEAESREPQKRTRFNK